MPQIAQHLLSVRPQRCHSPASRISRTISATKSSYKELTQALLDLGIPAEDIGEINID